MIIQHGTQDNLQRTEIVNPTHVSVVNNTIIILQLFPMYPYGIETKICRFGDAFVARDAYEIVKKAIAYNWGYVDLIPKVNNPSGKIIFAESATPLTPERI